MRWTTISATSSPLATAGCETNDGASGTAFWNDLWEEAAAQGQTAFVSSGDSGAAGCSSSSAAYGSAYGVNALGSSAYNVAVGGTMFVDFGPAQYWGASTSIPYTTALSYIPEAPWNQSRLTTTYLNSTSTATVTGSGIVGAGGGISIYTARPSWQTGSGIPTNSDAINVYSGTGIAAGSPITGLHRLVPDVSFIAASGHDGTLFCYEGGCYQNGSGGLASAGIVGGTSVAAPAMASVQALIDSANGGRQGNANFYFYPLANQQYNRVHHGLPGSDRDRCQPHRDAACIHLQLPRRRRRLEHCAHLLDGHCRYWVQRRRGLR